MIGPVTNRVSWLRILRAELLLTAICLCCVIPSVLAETIDLPTPVLRPPSESYNLIDKNEALPDSMIQFAEAMTLFAEGSFLDASGDDVEALRKYEQAALLLPEDPSIMEGKASCLFDLRRFDESLAMARQVLAIDSTRVDGLWFAGAVLYSQRNVHQAIDPLRRLIRIKPDRRAINLLINIYERSNRWEDLLEPLGMLIDLNYSAPQLLERRAQILTGLGRYSEAINDYWKIVEYSPTYPGIAEQMAALFTQQGDSQGLIDFFRTMIEKIPSDKTLRWKLVDALIDQRSWVEAEEELDWIRQNDPEDNLVTLQQGLIAYRLGDNEKALQMIDRALCLGARPELGLTWKMRVHFTMENTDSALVIADQILAQYPDIGDAWRIRALCLVEEGKLEDALESARHWADVVPNNPEPFRLAAAICRDMYDLERGVRMAEQAWKIAPSNYDITFEYAAYLEAVGDLDKAEVLVRQILEQIPNDPQALNFLGYMMVTRGQRLDDAEELIEKAIKQDPDQPAYLDSMGWLWYKKGKLKRAIGWLEEAITKGGRDPAIYRHHAQVKLELGDKVAARRTLELGLKWNPANRSLLQFLEELDDDLPVNE